MQVKKSLTQTYTLTDLDRLDPVFVYVTNRGEGAGKLVIECFGDCWAHYWGAMGPRTVQEFVLSAENDYLLGKLLKETRQTDFDEINRRAAEAGVDLCVTNDVEVALQADDMTEAFGGDWMMDLPRCHTSEYRYVSRILDAVKAAFSQEADQ